jgi:hypothetical protein
MSLTLLLGFYSLLFSNQFTFSYELWIHKIYVQNQEAIESMHMVARKSNLKNEKSNVYLEKSLSREEITKILGAVTYDRAFYFYDGIDKPNGEFAVSLSDFCNKINVVSLESLAFHLKRQDFQNWIGKVIGDVDLAKRLDKVQVKNNALRSTLHAFVSNRIKELQDSWPIVLSIH